MTGVSWKVPEKHGAEAAIITATMLRNTAKQAELIDLWIAGFTAVRLFNYVADLLESRYSNHPV